MDVVAIIVTYNPDLATLGRLVDKCLPQVDAIVLVDNGDGATLQNWLSQRVSTNVALLPMGHNKGIASAQNVGIEWARKQKAKHVLIFDHDSEPPPDLVVRLRMALDTLTKSGKKVAAVGPRYIDSRRKEIDSLSPFVQFKKGRLVRCYPEEGTSYVAVDFLISSGSLIPMNALDALGAMEECLFIDYVDVEWGLRARMAGWSLYGVWDAVMEHSLGDDFVVVFGREIAVHSPLRHYYLIRNAVWLCFYSKLRLRWKFTLAHNALKKLVAYSLFMPPQMKHFRFMCKGFWDGVCNRMGSYNK